MLPIRANKIEVVEFHAAEQELYAFFKRKTAKLAANTLMRRSRAAKQDGPETSNILSLINFLRLICNHGKSMLPTSALEAWETRKNSSIDWQMMQNYKQKCDVCKTGLEDNDFFASTDFRLPCEHIVCTACTSLGGDSAANEQQRCLKCVSIGIVKPSSQPVSPGTISVPPSSKVEALLKNLRSEQSLKNRSCTQRATKRYCLLIDIVIVFCLLLFLVLSSATRRKCLT